MARLAAMILCLALAACAGAPEPAAGPDPRPVPQGGIVYLPPVAEITLVTASGLREHQPDASDEAAASLAGALTAAVGEARTDYSEYAGAEALRLAGELGQPWATARPMPIVLPRQTGPAENTVALIIVRTDVESSASHLVQGGLGVLFGGVPGPDGVHRTARLVLYDPGTGASVWSHEVKGRDPRNPEVAKRLIDELLAPLGTVPPA